MLTRNIYNCLALCLALALWAILSAGCTQKTKGESGAADAAQAKAEAKEKDAQERQAKVDANAVNLLEPAGLLKFPPIEISPDRAGDALFASITNPRGGSPLVYYYKLEGNQLSEPRVLYQALNLIQSYVSSDPTGGECLIISNRKGQDGAIWDMVWRLVSTDMYPVYYEATPGLPQTGKPDTWYNLQPFYTWDGDQVVVPLKHQGLSITDVKGKKSSYALYPKLPFDPVTTAFGTLPTENGKRRIWASFGVLGSREDQCLLFALDLATLKWQQVIQTNWIILRAGGRNLDTEPWVVVGSRAPANGTEGRRFARYGRIDSASGSEQLSEFNGLPDFEVALEPHGDYIAYTDSSRKAIVRLNPATGELDLDQRWYADDAKLFISEGGERVFAFKQGALVLAQWSRHEKHKGWNDE
jgi:hypothetical protein